MLHWIKSIYYRIVLFFIPQDKTEYINYHILNQDEFYAKQDDFILKEVIYKDELKISDKNVRGIPTPDKHVLRIPYFVCAKREKAYIRELRKKAYVGVQNYPEYDRVKKENDELINQLNSIRNEIDLQSKELRVKIKFISYLKQELGVNAYESYERKFEQMYSRK
jgi:hypothetical protein